MGMDITLEFIICISFRANLMTFPFTIPISTADGVTLRLARLFLSSASSVPPSSGPGVVAGGSFV